MLFLFFLSSIQEKAIPAFQHIRRIIKILPGIVVDEIAPGIFNLSFLIEPLKLVAPSKMVNDIQDMRRIGFRDPRVSSDDDHVLVVHVGGFIAEVVAARNDDGIFGKGIDDDHFIMNDSMAQLVQFLDPISEIVRDASDADDEDIRRRKDRTAVNANSGFGGRGFVGDGAPDKEIGTFFLFLLRNVFDFSDDRRGTGIKNEEEDSFGGFFDDLINVCDVSGNGFTLGFSLRIRPGSSLRIRREPDGGFSLVSGESVGSRIFHRPFAQIRPLSRFVDLRILQELVPIFLVMASHLWDFQPDRVISLCAQAGGSPVRAPRDDALGTILAIEIDDEFIMPDALPKFFIVEETVVNPDIARLMEAGAGIGIGPVIELFIRVIGVRKNDFGAWRLFQLGDEFFVRQFVEGTKTFPVLGSGATEQGSNSIDHTSGEPGAEWILRLANEKSKCISAKAEFP